MGQIKETKKVKPFVGLLISDRSLLKECIQELEENFSPVDLTSPIIPFSHSTYYQAEMGNQIDRLWVSFVNLVDPGELAIYKLKTNTLEENLSMTYNETGQIIRRVNIDPGYLSDSSIILASTKNYNHRIYLQAGIYAEVTLTFRREFGWQPYPWTYPDYQDPIALKFFAELRLLYRSQESQMARK